MCEANPFPVHHVTTIRSSPYSLSNPRNFHDINSYAAKDSAPNDFRYYDFVAPVVKSSVKLRAPKVAIFKGREKYWFFAGI